MAAISEIQFPLIIREKDDDSWAVFDSSQAAEDGLEIWDVEQGAYEAWDALGRAVALRSVEHEEQEALRRMGPLERIRFSWGRRAGTRAPARGGHWLRLESAAAAPDEDLRRRLMATLRSRGSLLGDDAPLEKLIEAIRILPY